MNFFDVEYFENKLTYHIDNKCVLYFTLDDGSDISIDDIKVDDCVININGKDLKIPNYPQEL